MSRELRRDVMYQLKPLSREAIAEALESAARYRLHNEPGAAESLCLDVLAVEPDNQEALKNIVLAMSDRLGKGYAIGSSDINDYVERLCDEYERAFYNGVVFEKRAKAMLANGGLYAYEMCAKAMECFERAESLRPDGINDPVLRWNECARLIDRNRLHPHIPSANDMIE